MSKVGLLGLGAYVPERIMTNDEWTEYVDTSDEWIRTRTGIERRRIAAPDQTTVDLAAEAAKVAMTDAGVGPGDIDEIIVATDTPEVFLPDTAAFLQDRLGIGQVPCYDLASSGCAGFVLALDVAGSRVIADPEKKVLVVGVELLTRLLDWHDRNSCVLFGDGAGSAVVSQGDDVVEILASRSGTDGTKRDILALETGGTRLPFSEEVAAKGLHKKLVMHGREVFKAAVAHMTESSMQVLEQAGFTIDDVDLVVPHQANLRILKSVQGRLGVPDDKIYINVQDYGNTGSASVPLALWEAREKGRIEAGDLVLMCAFGAGFHWSAMLLRF